MISPSFFISPLSYSPPIPLPTSPLSLFLPHISTWAPSCWRCACSVIWVMWTPLGGRRRGSTPPRCLPPHPPAPRRESRPCSQAQEAPRWTPRASPVCSTHLCCFTGFWTRTCTSPGFSLMSLLWHLSYPPGINKGLSYLSLSYLILSPLPTLSPLSPPPRVRSSPLKQSPGYQVDLVVQLVWVSGEPPPADHQPGPQLLLWPVSRRSSSLCLTLSHPVSLCLLLSVRHTQSLSNTLSLYNANLAKTFSSLPHLKATHCVHVVS